MPRQVLRAGTPLQRRATLTSTPQTRNEARAEEPSFRRMIQNAGLYNEQQTLKGLQAINFSAAELSKLGYTTSQLTAREVAAPTPPQPKPTSTKQFTDQEKLTIRADIAAGNRQKLPSVTQLRQIGLTAVELKKVGYSLPALKAGGYTAPQLKESGYSARHLSMAGFTLQQLLQAGLDKSALQQANLVAPQPSVTTQDLEALRRQQAAQAQLTAQAQLNQTQLAQAQQTQAQLNQAQLLAQNQIALAQYQASNTQESNTQTSNTQTAQNLLIEEEEEIEEEIEEEVYSSTRFTLLDDADEEVVDEIIGESIMKTSPQPSP